MIKSILLALLSLLISGCSTHSADPEITPATKAFIEEDEYILYALRAEELKQFSTASKLFDVLYTRSGKKEYLYRSLSTQLQAEELDSLLERTSGLLKQDANDLEVRRFEVLALLKNREYEQAKARALLLVELSHEPEDYLLVSESYSKQQRFDQAVKYLESAYAIDYDERILDKMAIILYVDLKRKDDAISYLETHSRLNGCSKIICGRLAGFYSESNDVDGMLSTYRRLYELEPEEEYAQAVVKIYNYQKKYLKLMLFLQKSGVDDPMLLQLYINNKSYKKAAELAQKLYDERGDITFLGQYAIFTYESAKEKSDRKMLTEVMQTIETVLEQSDDPLYLNYIGYLLIDHDMDVPRGMEYVKAALRSEPDSAFYQDSLAWGHYKLGECDTAMRLMKQVESALGSKDEEVLSHMEAIKKCLQRKNSQ